MPILTSQMIANTLTTLGLDWEDNNAEGTEREFIVDDVKIYFDDEWIVVDTDDESYEVVGTVDELRAALDANAKRWL